jgi:Icc-related predicted phosphoesterase
MHGNSNALTWAGNVAMHYGVDVVTISGDICTNARYRHFVRLLGELSDHARSPVICIPGNHDYWRPEKVFGWRSTGKGFLDANAYRKNGFFHRIKGGKSILQGVLCLIDEQIEFGGFKFYGTPWTTEFNDWNWMKPVSELTFDIPQDTDILLCHSPPFGYGDATKSEERIGSEALTEAIKNTPRLKAAFFGHAHENHGWVGKINNTLLANVSMVDERNELVTALPVFEIDSTGKCHLLQFV